MELASGIGDCFGTGTVGLRSPLVIRRRISSRSLGSDRRDEVNARREDGEPEVDEDTQLSRMD